MDAVHFGALVPQGWKREFVGLDARSAYRTMIDTAKALEEAHFDSIWLYDHFHAIPPPPIPTPVFECWTSMMGLAQNTERVKLGQMVTCALYRNPAYLAKISSCVDVASDGRLQMGLGAGWYWDEFNAYGFGFPSNAERIGTLRDTVEIVKRMWSDEKATYEGKYHSVKDALSDPKPLQRPRPPLWIGGSGPKLTLRLVAEHADYANFWGLPEVWASHRDILYGHCEAVGRDPAEIRLTTHQDCMVAKDDAGLAKLLERYGPLWEEPKEPWVERNLVGTVQQVVDKIGSYVELGASGFITWFPTYPDTESMELFATEVMPQFPRG
jgi:F420-dependent oxidoreductase-like protein